MSVHRLEFQRPEKLLNQNDRQHWAAAARVKRTWRSAAFYAATNAKNRKVVAPISEGVAVVTISLPVASTQRRDGHNFSPTAKCIIDGMVDAGIFVDDSTAHLYLNDIQFHLGDSVIVLYMQSKVIDNGSHQ